jgi:hypothetical protein
VVVAVECVSETFSCHAAQEHLEHLAHEPNECGDSYEGDDHQDGEIGNQQDGDSYDGLRVHSGHLATST